VVEHPGRDDHLGRHGLEHAQHRGLVPRLVAQTALAAAITAYRQWLDDESSDLTALIDEAMRLIGTGFTDEALTARG